MLLQGHIDVDLRRTRGEEGHQRGSPSRLARLIFGKWTGPHENLSWVRHPFLSPYFQA